MWRIQVPIMLTMTRWYEYDSIRWNTTLLWNICSRWKDVTGCLATTTLGNPSSHAEHGQISSYMEHGYLIFGTEYQISICFRILIFNDSFNRSIEFKLSKYWTKISKRNFKLNNELKYSTKSKCKISNENQKVSMSKVRFLKYRFAMSITWNTPRTTAEVATYCWWRYQLTLHTPCGNF